MEKRDLALIEKHVTVDAELKKYVDEHQKFEEILEAFKKKPHLSAEEQLEEKRIKKLKLKGRDKIESILSKYRNDDQKS
jgi:uncharacterized protein YdcH (DUF465 family)